MTTPKTGLALLREPFPPHQILRKPKPTKAQKMSDKSGWVNCAECGQRHARGVIHLDYVGHAALTDRLLDCDPLWSWEPMAIGQDGLPVFDAEGGLWGRITVCGHRVIGYGNAEAEAEWRAPGDRIKECIGDMLRNGCMRLGAALELWHKGKLHDDEPAATASGPDLNKVAAAIVEKHFSGHEYGAYEEWDALDQGDKLIVHGLLGPHPSVRKRLKEQDERAHAPPSTDPAPALLKELTEAAEIGNDTLKAAYIRLKRSAGFKAVWDTNGTRLKLIADGVDNAGTPPPNDAIVDAAGTYVSDVVGA